MESNHQALDVVRQVGRRLARIFLSKDAALVVLGSGATILGSYVGHLWDADAQMANHEAARSSQVVAAAGAAFDEISRAANEITRLQHQVFAAAVGDPSVPPLDSALRALDAVAHTWRRDVPRLQALGRAYFCFSGNYLISSTDHMLNHYFNSVREVQRQTKTHHLAGAARPLSPEEREAWRVEARWYQDNVGRSDNLMDEHLKVVATFQKWMAMQLQLGLAGRDTTGC